jgi:hypothetical protein
VLPLLEQVFVITTQPRLLHKKPSAYRSSSKGDQVKELSRRFWKNYCIASKWVCLLVQESVNYKGFVNVNLL